MTSKILHKLFPTPTFLAMPSVSVTFSEQALYMADLKRHRGFVRLQRYDEKSFSPEAVSNGRVMSSEPLIEVLDELRWDHRLRFVSTALPEERGFVYATDISQIDHNDKDSVREYISFNFEENVPLSLTNAIFDFDVVEFEDGSPQAVVFAFDREMVEQWLEVFKQAGLRPLTMEPESRALSRAVIGWHDHRTHVLLHIKNEITNISIIMAQQVVFTSTVNKGLKNLKAGLAESDEDTGQPWLKQEMDKIFRYWGSHHTAGSSAHNQIDNVLVCGEDLGAEQVIETISEQLGPQIEIANVWKNVASFDQYIPEISYAESFRYSIAIGLSLAQFKD